MDVRCARTPSPRQVFQFLNVGAGNEGCPRAHDDNRMHSIIRFRFSDHFSEAFGHATAECVHGWVIDLKYSDPIFLLCHNHQITPGHDVG